MEAKSKSVVLHQFERSRNSLQFVFLFNQRLSFPFTYTFDDHVDFFELEKYYGIEFMNYVYFHIIAFEGNKFCSLALDEISWGIFDKFADEKFESIWRCILHNVWAQWRYENNLPYYEGPKFVRTAQLASIEPIEIKKSSGPDILMFCSGGKDSLACLNMINKADIPVDILAYSSSIYGDHDNQKTQCNRLLEQFTILNCLNQQIEDSFMLSDILKDEDVQGITTLCAGETPSSVFGCLPFVLARGYKHIVLGHERSANAPQCFWSVTNEQINHQWGKSFEAESIINQYIQKNIVSNFSYFSILQPIHDAVIFSSLNTCFDKAFFTNSCNYDLKGCEKCAKCLYVFLGFRALLPLEIQNKFRTNIFDSDQQVLFEEMLGLKEHLPFDCIGQKEEIAFFFALCASRDIKGLAIENYKKSPQMKNIDSEKFVKTFLSVHDQHGIPEEIFNKVKPIMIEAAKEVQLKFKELQGKA